jgi:hypothetical protein
LAFTKAITGENNMWKMETEFSVKLGGNTYINTPNLIVYKGTPIFKILRSNQTGMLGIDFDVYDSTGARVATIAKGIVVQRDKANYTITTEHEEYTVKENGTNRQIASVKRRGVQGAELEVFVDLYTPSGFHLKATPTHTNMDGMTISGVIFQNSDTGIAVQ